jgi:hypothetical protein
MTYPLNKTNAVALRPIRIDVKRNRFIHYDAITWEQRPAANLDMYLRRLQACGHIAKEGDQSPLALDLLDEQGDILDTVEIDRRGFEYLRSKLCFRRERVNG